MLTSSCKSKGRRLAQRIVDVLLERFPKLQPDDVRATPSGVNGPDVQLSPAARRKFPFAVEAKNVESLALKESWAQARAHSALTGLTPLLVFSRNRSAPCVILRLGDALRTGTSPDTVAVRRGRGLNLHSCDKPVAFDYDDTILFLDTLDGFMDRFAPVRDEGVGA